MLSDLSSLFGSLLVGLYTIPLDEELASSKQIQICTHTRTNNHMPYTHVMKQIIPTALQICLKFIKKQNGLGHKKFKIKTTQYSSLLLGLGISILRKKFTKSEYSVECYGHGILIAGSPANLSVESLSKHIFVL